MASRPAASPSQECETAAADEAVPQIQVMSMSLGASLSALGQPGHASRQPCTGGNKNLSSWESLGDAHEKLGPGTHGTN